MIRPIAGVDYPQTLAQFDARFSTEEACVDFLRSVRWPQTGFLCPSCSSSSPPWPTSRGLLKCRECGRQASITAGTPLEKTRKPLRMWLQAMWFVASQKRGMSAVDLQRLLGLGSYQTAWAWLHKLRRVMVVPGRDKLTGWVDIDETLVGEEAGGQLSNAARTGRGVKKALVVVAVEVQEGRLGDVKGHDLSRP